MPSDNPARNTVEKWAALLLQELSAGHAGSVRLRVAETGGGLACLVLVWPADTRMPTSISEQSPVRKVGGGRASCRADILAAVRAAGRPLTRKEVTRALKTAGAKHGAGTVAKALAELTGTRELVNHKDKRGYRLPEWVRLQPRLFGD